MVFWFFRKKTERFAAWSVKLYTLFFHNTNNWKLSSYHVPTVKSSYFVPRTLYLAPRIPYFVFRTFLPRISYPESHTSYLIPAWYIVPSIPYVDILTSYIVSRISHLITVSLTSYLCLVSPISFLVPVVSYLTHHSSQFAPHPYLVVWYLVHRIISYVVSRRISYLVSLTSFLVTRTV